MLQERFGRFVPDIILRRLMRVEREIEQAVERFAAELPAGARVLDAGAGEGRYSGSFENQRYTGVDLGIGDRTWNYAGLDVIADLAALPFSGARFGAAIHIVTLEHTPEPEASLREIARVLKRGGALLLVAPQQWEVHQAPHDYFRYTRYGLAYLLRKSGFEVEDLQPIGGYFTLLARRLTGALNFFQGGWRWLLFFPAAAAIGPMALILPALDRLDSKKDFTLAYRCVARKP